jgi:hypothetical protein
MFTIIDEFSRFPFVFPCANIDSTTVIDCFSQLFAIFGMPAYIHSDRGLSFMSEDVQDFLHKKGIATSRTTPYNPQGNGQAERYNGIIMKTIKLALKSRNLDLKYWEVVLPDALHSIRSLINTTTNETPHERLLTFQRRSATGHSIPSWLTQPGKVLLKRHVRNSKYEPDVDEVFLIEANPQYALIKHASGRESTVSIRHLAPLTQESSADTLRTSNLIAPEQSTAHHVKEQDKIISIDQSTAHHVQEQDKTMSIDPPDYSCPTSDKIENEMLLRRSTRKRTTPTRLDL